MTKKEDTIQMAVGGLTLDPVTKTPIVILKDTENKLNLPIWIGLLEATAMATEIEGIKMARPMTHDLLKTILGEVGCSVESVEITELKENTYYAAVNLKLAGRQVIIDSRPSDAIALALRTKSPSMLPKPCSRLRACCSRTRMPNVRWKTSPMSPKRNGLKS
jgi:Uncharacterized conserved protein